MITAPDFSKKQIVFVMFNEGEKLAFGNDNMIVRNADGSIKFQCSCYRLFVIYAVGHYSITSAIIQKADKFGFFIALMTPSFKLYSVIGAIKDGNTLLKRRQYAYESLDIGKQIIKNKISNQRYVLKSVRDKSDAVKEAIISLELYQQCITSELSLKETMAYEGLASKAFFKNHFNNVEWNGRLPRIKHDITNSVLDVGYTLLFAFVEALLESYGFDTYCGVFHRQFYMRKSLVCDIVEPFRCLIDMQVKKSLNLRQIKETDFIIINGQYRLKWEASAEYVKFLMKPLIDNKDEIFAYIQSYYRAFMKELPAEEFPQFKVGGVL